MIPIHKVANWLNKRSLPQSLGHSRAGNECPRLDLGRERAGREESKVELEHALRKLESLGAHIRSQNEMKRHIVEVAREYGFNNFMRSRSGCEEPTVLVRAKYYWKYHTPPNTRVLDIPDKFVKRLHSIYKNWHQLGEFLLRTVLWHEHQHLHQDPIAFADDKKREDEANKLMIDKMGRLGLIVSAWYFSLYRESEAWSCILKRILNLNREKRLDRDEAEKVVHCLQSRFPNLVSPDQHEEVVDEVSWLNEEYQLRTLSNGC